MMASFIKFGLRLDYRVANTQLKHLFEYNLNHGNVKALFVNSPVFFTQGRVNVGTSLHFIMKELATFTIIIKTKLMCSLGFILMAIAFEEKT